MRHQITLVRMAKFTANDDKDVEKGNTLTLMGMKPGTATLENSVERPRKLLIQSNSFQILPLSPQIHPTLDSRRLLCSCIHYERTMMPHIAKVIRNIPLPLFLNDTLELSRSKLILREFSALYLTSLKMSKLNCYCCKGMFIKI